MTIGQSTKDLYSRFHDKRAFLEAAEKEFKRDSDTIYTHWVNKKAPKKERQRFYQFTNKWARKDILERIQFIKRNEMTVNALEKQVEYQEVKP